MISSTGGLLLILSAILLFGGVAYLISWFYTRGDAPSKAQYLVANRKLGFFESSFSVAATWIWAPALFVSAQQAYVHGWLGLFWFVVPNILCLIFFAFVADKIRHSYPNGFTLSDYMRTQYSTRVQGIYWVTLVSLTVCAFAVQLLAGGHFIQTVTGIPFFWGTIILALVPLAYSFVYGLKSSVITDFAKMVLILGLGAIIVPGVLMSFDSGVISARLGGRSGNYISFFSNESWILFLSFGLPITIGLMSGPFGDQSFWQRAFATKAEHVKSAFITAAFIFGAVPLMMGAIGLAAAGSGLTVQNIQLTNVETIFAAMGTLGVILFFLMTFSALTSILDSKMCSISSIAGHDIAERYGLQYLTSAKASVIMLTIGALLIANIPGLKILHLFLFYGTLRSATLIPTVCTILGRKLNEARTFYGILAAVTIGLPIFAYGNFNGIPAAIVTGSLLTVLMPALFNAKLLVGKKVR